LIDSNGNVLTKATFEISNESLAKIIQQNPCIIEANEKNILGKTTLTAHYNDLSFTKDIRIIPLW